MIRKKSDAGIIIISAKDERMTKVDMLRSGADDYITKPFDNEEVAARIEAQIRRLKKYRTPQVLTFKDIILNEETKQVTVNNIPVSLTAREYKLLRLFLTYPKKLFTKENIFAAIWESEYFDSANVVNVHMSNLRTKLAKANPDEEYIETIWGMGYRLKT
jgi:DNA-binding response OmpR family regulator